MTDSFTPKQLRSQHAAIVTLAWRAVETQERVATREITNTAEEQERLEFLLEDFKPKLPEDCEGYSYLLSTPFRYPPLRHGSRFGNTHERGIFYCSIERETALAESAFYLWLFQSGMEDPGPFLELKASRTLFSVKVSSTKSLDLSQPFFDKVKNSACARGSWTYSQGLGEKIRRADTEFLLYPSARYAGKNGAAFSPKAFAAKRPEQQELWHVRLSQDLCWFGRTDGKAVEFKRQDFEDENGFSHPCFSENLKQVS